MRSRNNYRRTTIAFLGVGTAFLGLLAVAQLDHTTWTEYLGNADGAHYTALKQIDKSNVGGLQIAWTYPAEQKDQFESSPLVVDNIAYVVAKGGSLVALDASTGEELWCHSFAPTFARTGTFSWSGIRSRGLSYWESQDRSDRRILVEASGFLQAIDARTGKTIESFGDHGKVDLKIGIDVNYGQPLSATTPGRVFENLILLGSSTGEEYISPSGDLRAFNVVTGKLAWVFHTVPRPGEFGYDTWPKDAWKYIGGTNTWGEISVDEKRGIAYFPLGSPTYDFYGADRKGAGLFGDCLLALDARTGKYLWHFQMIHHDLWDYDETVAPQLITIRANGKTIDAVAEATKQGFLYVFDRVTGEPVWPIVERPVPKSEMPGEYAWPTQPFPTVIPPFARQTFTADDIDQFFLSPEERALWKARIANAANDGLYTPPAYNHETVMMPGHNGGANFFGSASDPAHGLVYVVAKNVPALIKIGEKNRSEPETRDEGIAPTRPQLGRAVYEANCIACHGPDLKGAGPFPSLEGVVGRRGSAGVMSLLQQGSGQMPSFNALPQSALDSLLVFLTDPSAAPAATQPRIFGPSAERPYPPGVDAPKVRYYNSAVGGGLLPTIISPPWSTLTAYDLNTGKIKWQVPYGDASIPGPSEQLRGNIFQKSGIVVTASGLIFYAGNEGKLRILDSDTGRQVRPPIDLPRGSEGVPAVYEVNGREYILINATGGVEPFPNGAPWPSMPPWKENGAYVAVALPKPAKGSMK
jgi:quinoprotein glucose dehydrogenase